MRAAVVTDFGNANQLQIVEIPTRGPGRGTA
jgi:hypothetical protein